MSFGVSYPQPNRERDPSRPLKGDEVALQEGMHGGLDLAAAAAAAAAEIVPSLFFAKGKEIGEISEKIKGLSEENSRLRDKIKALRKDNTTMNDKIETLESQNRKQRETIRSLESSQEKLQKELENVKKAKDRLRIDLEKKISAFDTQNTILAEKLEALTKEFEAVEDENKELKRSLEELTTSNNSLKQNVESIERVNKNLEERNQKLEDAFGNLEAEHAMIREKLERKETRLALGQVAWLLEQEIWKHVLPDEKMGKTCILFSMERWLKRNGSSKKGTDAKKRWEDLKKKLNWDEDDHKSALKILKELRKDDAHPTDVDLEVARTQLNDGNYVADVEKKSCEEIINMIVEARKLNNTTK